MKSLLIKLPRRFRILWGKAFIYMLGRVGTDEFYNDINLFNELSHWIETDGKPNVNNMYGQDYEDRMREAENETIID